MLKMPIYTFLLSTPFHEKPPAPFFHGVTSAYFSWCHERRHVPLTTPPSFPPPPQSQPQPQLQPFSHDSLFPFLRVLRNERLINVSMDRTYLFFLISRTINVFPSLFSFSGREAHFLCPTSILLPLLSFLRAILFFALFSLFVFFLQEHLLNSFFILSKFFTVFCE